MRGKFELQGHKLTSTPYVLLYTILSNSSNVAVSTSGYYKVWSSKYSHFFLRLGLTVVFLWFGIDKFFHPDYWINAWTPKWFLDFIARFNLSALNFIYFNGVFEVVIGLAILSNIFIKFFSFLGAIFLIAVIIIIGLNEITIRDIGLVGGLISLILWPKNNRY